MTTRSVASYPEPYPAAASPAPLRNWKADLAAWFSAACEHWVRQMQGSQEPTIREVRDRVTNESFWEVYDPTADRITYFMTESEVMVWLDQRRYR